MPVQRFAQVFGAVYLLVGLLGFAFTGFGGFAATSDDKLLLFGVNPLHNIVHLAVGALWLASSRSEASARAVSILIGAVYLVVGVLGLFINGSSDLNILNINQPNRCISPAPRSVCTSGWPGAATRWHRQPDGRGGRAGRGVPGGPLGPLLFPVI